MSSITSARDLSAAVRDLRPDAVALGIDITSDWCREQMHDLGITRYEDVGDETLGAIADRVDALASEADTDPRYVASNDPRAILRAWGGADEQSATMDMGGWTEDGDEEAFRSAVQAESMRGAGEPLAYIVIERVEQ